MERRRFLSLAGATGVGLGAAMAGFSTSRAWATPTFPDDPFTLGVASGDPWPDGVVLWTRLAPDPLAVDGLGGMPATVVPVEWEVAEDEHFRQVARRGVARATPELGHSVHAEVGGLQPGREYFYRFRAGDAISPAGRTKTAPAAGSRPDVLNFAFASCQNLPAGYYTAYRHLVREDLDLVVFLGDYIYEGSAQGSIGRGHLPAAEIFSLADYRIRYGQYKSDLDLQAAHAALPWVVTWDDHEVENNYAADVPQNPADAPIFLARRAAAYQAYYEHQPLRRSSLPDGPDMRIYRRLRYGTLAEFNVLDGRQYRSDQPCGDGRKDCEDRFDPSLTMLGEKQERWLMDGLTRSAATWNVLANQVFMMQADAVSGPERGFGMDTWNGYVAARQRLFSGVQERGVDNVVVITGDAHRNAASDLKLNFDDPDSATVGAEFLGTSISSGGNGADMDPAGEIWLQENPHIKFVNAQRGYVRCTLTPDEYRTDYRLVPYVTQPGADVYTRASFVVENGRPGLHQVGAEPVQGQKYSSTFESEIEQDAARATH